MNAEQNEDQNDDFTPEPAGDASTETPSDATDAPESAPEDQEAQGHVEDAPKSTEDAGQGDITNTEVQGLTPIPQEEQDHFNGGPIEEVPPKGRIIEPGEEVTFSGHREGNKIVSDEDVFRKVFPMGSKRPTYVRIFKKGRQVKERYAVALSEIETKPED